MNAEVFCLGNLVRFWKLFNNIAENESTFHPEKYWTNDFWNKFFVSQMPILAKIPLADRKHIPTTDQTIYTLIAEHNKVQSSHEKSTVMAQIIMIRQQYLKCVQQVNDHFTFKF